MEKTVLKAEVRKILGKKVKRIRKEGTLPANLFGKGIKSKSLQVTEKDFREVFKQVGETGVVTVKVEGEDYPALIHNIQLQPKTDAILHADFHKVNLKEKITTHVPVSLEGESPAEKTGVGLLLQTISEVEVESLPADIPHEIKVDVSKLEEVGQSIHVKDLKVAKDKVEIKNDPEATVITVQTAEMKEEPVEETPAPEEVEATAEKGEKEEAEGSQAGGEKPSQESSEEKPQES
ncbi:MAG: 50S ribosomal protein L25 [Candidatus Woykebacteria bacterium]